MFRLRKVPRRAPRAATAVFSLAALVSACGPASLASASSGGATTAPLSVTWMPSYAAPGHAGAVQQGRRPQGRPELRQERPRPGTGDLGRQRLLRAAGQMDRFQDAGLAGVVGRAAGEPARGRIGAEPLQGGESHGDPALRLLPRLPQGPEDHAPLPDGPELDRRVRQELGDERRRPGPAYRDRSRQEARRQGRPRRALPRRLGRDRLCHLGLQRETGSRSTGGPGVHRRGQRPDPRGPRLERRADDHDRCAGDPGAPGVRCAVGVSLAELRRDRGTVRRAVRSHRVRGRAARSQRALPGSDLGAPARRHRAAGAGLQHRPVRLRPERRHLAAGSRGGPGAPR